MGPPAVLRWEPRFRPASWLWQQFLVRYDFWAIPMPWRVVHVRRDIFSGNTHALRQHERVHYEQMERDGTVWWHIKYFVLLFKYGYMGNPYEVEAYARYSGADFLAEMQASGRSPKRANKTRVA